MTGAINFYDARLIDVGTYKNDLLRNHKNRIGSKEYLRATTFLASNSVITFALVNSRSNGRDERVFICS